MRSIKTLLGSSLLALSLVATHVPAAEKPPPFTSATSLGKAAASSLRSCD